MKNDKEISVFAINLLKQVNFHEAFDEDYEQVELKVPRYLAKAIAHKLIREALICQGCHDG